jgi:hypothetical protein
MSLPYIAQAADHQRLEWIGGGVMNVLLDAEATDGQLVVLRSRLTGGSGLHRSTCTRKRTRCS